MLGILSFQVSYGRIRQELDETAYADGYHTGIQAALARFPSHRNWRIRQAIH